MTAGAAPLPRATGVRGGRPADQSRQRMQRRQLMVDAEEYEAMATALAGHLSQDGRAARRSGGHRPAVSMSQQKPNGASPQPDEACCGHLTWGLRPGGIPRDGVAVTGI